ncbi:MAG: hypothetical protein J6L86_08115 [Alphaproteobacteria bacterium]|nr:hypothetical protein [Alphaproteobacteria bacterium]
MRGVTLELNPETGEFEAVPVTEENNEEKKGRFGQDRRFPQRRSFRQT